jgi:tetratricopeptide (TPR) repeat protein
MPGRQRRDVGPSFAGGRDSSDYEGPLALLLSSLYEGQLAELLANLKVDPGDPDLWMEAATIYVALGRQHRASKAYRASIEAVNERQNDDEAALARVHLLLHGDDLPAGEDGRTEPQPDLASGSAVLDQLRQELAPPKTTTCPECNTLLEVGEPLCPGCGQELREEGESLEGRVDRARKSLEQHGDDPDALFTLAAHLAVSGQSEEALETLIRLTAVDPRYPGLWWVKARVFLDAGKPEAAQASLRMARRIMIESGHGIPV